jgi:hypothetical protein
MMAPAPGTTNISSSKRKFYKLLDNLSSSKANLLATGDKNASSVTLAEPPNKRTRGLGLLGKDRPLTAPSSGTRPVSVAGGRPTSSVRAVGGLSGSLDKRRPNSYAVPRGGLGGSGTNILKDRKTPNYSPWDHERFLARLQTYADVRTWSSKPAQLSEVEWAKRGWVVVGKDMVCCKGGCEKSLVISLKGEGDLDREDVGEGDGDEEGSSWWASDAEREIVNKYQELIVEGHAADCLWRRSGCKDDIYGIKMADPVVWHKALKERYSSLMTVKDEMPTDWGVANDETLEHHIQFNVDDILDALPVELLTQMAPAAEGYLDPQANRTTAGPAHSPSSEPHTIDKTALALAVCGWTGQSLNGVNLVTCPKCFQRIGLWLYNQDALIKNREERKKKGINALVADEDEEDSDTTPMFFDPVDLHREHCPWKNVASQCSSGTLAGMPGWQILVTLATSGARKRVEADAVTLRGSEDSEESSRPKSRSEVEAEDKNRRSRIQRIKRAFTVKKKSRS